MLSGSQTLYILKQIIYKYEIIGLFIHYMYHKFIYQCILNIKINSHVINKLTTTSKHCVLILLVPKNLRLYSEIKIEI